MKKKKQDEDDFLPQDEPLPTYTESNTANKASGVGGAEPEMSMMPKSAMKKVAPTPLILDLHNSGSSSVSNSPVLGPAPPPKVHRKSNPGARPRRKSNLAPVSEEEPDSSGSRLALVKDDDGNSSSAPPTPRTPRSAAFHALTGDSNSGPNSPMNSSFTLEPVPPLPDNVSPTRSKFRDKK